LSEPTIEICPCEYWDNEDCDIPLVQLMDEGVPYCIECGRRLKINV